LFLLKWVLKNQRSLLLLGTKTETAMAMNIQPWMKTHGFDFPSVPGAAFGAGLDPGGDIF
jgi:hypothetical protein